MDYNPSNKQLRNLISQYLSDNFKFLPFTLMVTNFVIGANIKGPPLQKWIQNNQLHSHWLGVFVFLFMEKMIILPLKENLLLTFLGYSEHVKCKKRAAQFRGLPSRPFFHTRKLSLDSQFALLIRFGSTTKPGPLRLPIWTPSTTWYCALHCRRRLTRLATASRPSTIRWTTPASNSRTWSRPRSASVSSTLSASSFPWASYRLRSSFSWWRSVRPRPNTCSSSPVSSRSLFGSPHTPGTWYALLAMPRTSLTDFFYLTGQRFSWTT